jgi:hypothetical protein
MAAPATPTELTPEHLSTVLTSDFLVSATLKPWPNRQKAQFQFATNSGFSTNVHTSETPFRNPGATTTNVGTPRLPQGTVFFRVRAIDEASGDPSPWSSTHQITVTHPSTALLVNPADDTFIPWVSGNVTFQWQFKDTSSLDAQLAWRLRVQAIDSDITYGVISTVYPNYGAITALNDNYADLSSSNGSTTLIETSKTLSPAQSTTVTLPNSARNEIIRWQVQTWDNDDQSAGYCDPSQLFVGDLPTITITAPLSTVATPTPTVTWAYTHTAGLTQGSYRVQFFRTSTGRLLFDSGIQAGSVTSYVAPSQILQNGVQATIRVDTFSVSGIRATATINTTPQWTAPPNPSIDVITDFYHDFGRVDIEWLTAPTAATFIEWRVYRRSNDLAPWKFLGRTTTKRFVDHGAPPLSTVQYSVTQVGTAFGVQVESPLIPISVDLTTTAYLLTVKDDPGLVVPLKIVTADDYTHEFEEEVFEIIGVGRKAEVGTKFGRSGSLTVHFRDMGVEQYARALYERLVSIKEDGRACYLRIPFGDTLEVHIGGLSVSRVAGVTSELNDVTIEYREVTD